MTTDLVALSVRLEEQTGYDSIPTIERVYDRYPNGSYACCWPDCGRRTREAVAMWRHVHFQSHGLSFDRTWEEVTASTLDDPEGGSHAQHELPSKEQPT
jgi:hypothetical protein